MLRLPTGIFDRERRQWLRDGRAYPLSPLEASLLAYLADRPGQLVSRGDLLTEVWGYAPGVETRAVDNTVRRLRKKIEADPTAPVVLVSVYGGGYRLDGLAAPEPPMPARGSGGMIGRQQELAALRAASGWVTILGPGGIGKTRLALELLGEGPGWFVDLAAARDAAEIVPLVSLRLGIPPSDRSLSDSVRRIGELLADRGGRLVLDNLEQLGGDAVQAAAGWRAPGLTIVGTSRRALGIPGEAVGRLQPLAAEDARVLLVERSRPAEPEDPLLAALVERLEGNPLAIELAAGRIGLLGPAGLLDRLDRPTRVLRGNDRTRPERHRSLAACIAWSWELLDEAQRRVLLACAAAPAGLVAEAVEAIEGDGLEAIEGLVGASLLHVVREDVPRFRPYDAVRDWVLEHAERREVTHALAAWLADRIERPGDLIEELPNVAAFMRDPGVPDPIVARLGRAVERLQRQVPRELCVALYERAEAAAARAGLDGSALDLAIARCGMQSVRGRGDLAVAEALRERADRSGTIDQQLRARRILGALLRRAGRLPEAGALYEEALTRCEPGHPRRPELLEDLALVRRRAGDREAERTLLIEALAAYRARGHVLGEASCLGNLAGVARALGELEEAEHLGRQALAGYDSAGDRHMVAGARVNLANLLAIRGRHDEARELAHQAIAGHAALGSRLGEGFARLLLGNLLVYERRWADAEAEFVRARDLLQAAGDARAAAAAAAGMGSVALGRGRFTEAAEAYAAVERRLYDLGANDVAALLRALRAIALAAAGDPAAEALLEDLPFALRVHAGCARFLLGAPADVLAAALGVPPAQIVAALRADLGTAMVADHVAGRLG